ncbi:MULTISPECIES: hypothetical protein [unclassified Oceanobacillus]|uniref:hypothetical protein n=1 Tax=unclassified Oceanobacillus TaxID=2630292 RepID=UPI00300DF2DE
MAILVKSQELEMTKKNELIEELNLSRDFVLLISEIQKHHKDVEVKETETMSLTFAPDKNGEGVKVAAIFVRLHDEVIIQALKQGEDLRVKAHFSTINEFGEKMVVKAIVEDEEVKIENQIEFNAEYFLFVEELKNPQGADEISEVAPAAWYEGCLIFYSSGEGKYYYYRYCGSGCNGKNFTQTPINPLDSCCRSHDRCWANFGKGDDGCDYQLYTCANRTSDPGWWMIAEFGLLCSQGKLGSVC